MDKEQRNKNNNDILARMKAGEPLQYNAALTWFPPRPTVRKDKNIVKELYGDNVTVIGEPKKFEITLVKD